MASCPKCGDKLRVITDEFDDPCLLVCDGPICGWSAEPRLESWNGLSFPYNPLLWWEEYLHREARLLAEMPEYPGRDQY